MLSPGEWHKLVPEDLGENLAVRQRINTAARNNPALQRRIRQICKDDILFYINLFVWQFNPKKKGNAAIAPFITWDFQDALFLDTPETTGEKGILWCYEHDKSMVVQKSREMGLSWCFLIAEDWLSLFHPHVQSLNISRNEKAVDAANPDSLFWKVRYMHGLLADWLKGPIVQHKLHFEFEKTGSYINGEASTGEAGVGGRASVVFVDEFPLIKEASEVRQRTAGTSDCRFFNGTHQGVGTEFARLCDRTLNPEIILRTIHWSQHPDKKKGLYEYDPEHPGVPIIHDKTFDFPPDFEFVLDGTPTGGPRPGVRSPWYDSKCRDIGEARAIAMELDIDPQGSAKQFYSPIVIRELIQEFCRPPVWEGTIEYDELTGHFKGIQQVPNGRLKLWAMPDRFGRLPASEYRVGADVSMGTGATPSCASGGDASKGLKVLEYAIADKNPDEFACICTAICWFLQDRAGGPARLCWESAGSTGSKFGQRISKLGFTNIHMHVEEFMRGAKSSNRAGWYPTEKTKISLHMDYRTALEKRWILNPSRSSLVELLNFMYNSIGNLVHAGAENEPDPSGARGNHGDMGTADAIMWMLSKDLGVMPTLKKKPEPFEYGSLGWRRQYWKELERQEQY